MRVCENDRALGGRGLEKFSTVPLIALVISSREVYARATFKTQLGQ